MQFFFEDQDKLLDTGLIGMGVVIRMDGIALTPALGQLADRFKEQCGEIENAFDIGAVSTVEPPIGLYCTCHGHIEGERVTHFRLSLQRKPKAPPPKSLQESSDRLGGFSLGVAKLFEALEGQAGTARVEFDVAVFDSKRWASPVKKRRALKGIGQFALDSEELHLSDSSNNIKVTLRLEKGESGYSIAAKSKVDIKLDSNCFELAGQKVWQRLHPLIGNV